MRILSQTTVTETLITGNTEKPINYDLPGYAREGYHYSMRVHFVFSTALDNTTACTAIVIL